MTAQSHSLALVPTVPAQGVSSASANKTALASTKPTDRSHPTHGSGPVENRLSGRHPMTRRAIAFAILVWSTLGVMTPWSSAGLITFTGNPTDITIPSVPGGSGETDDTTSFTNIGNNGVNVTSGGFSISNGDFTYNTGDDDQEGQTLTMYWVSERPVTLTAGDYVLSSSFSGTYTINNGGTLDRVVVETSLSPPGTPAYFASADTKNFAPEGGFLAEGTSGVIAAKAGNYTLEQSGRITFTLGVNPEKLTIIWPNSSTSLIMSVPEPSSWILLGTSIVTLLVVPQLRLSRIHSRGQYREPPKNEP